MLYYAIHRFGMTSWLWWLKTMLNSVCLSTMLTGFPSRAPSPLWERTQQPRLGRQTTLIWSCFGTMKFRIIISRQTPALKEEFVDITLRYSDPARSYTVNDRNPVQSNALSACISIKHANKSTRSTKFNVPCILRMP